MGCLPSLLRVLSPWLASQGHRPQRTHESRRIANCTDTDASESRRHRRSRLPELSEVIENAHGATGSGRFGRGFCQWGGRSPLGSENTPELDLSLSGWLSVINHPFLRPFVCPYVRLSVRTSVSVSQVQSRRGLVRGSKGKYV